MKWLTVSNANEKWSQRRKTGQGQGALKVKVLVGLWRWRPAQDGLDRLESETRERHWPPCALLLPHPPKSWTQIQETLAAPSPSLCIQCPSNNTISTTAHTASQHYSIPIEHLHVLVIVRQRGQRVKVRYASCSHEKEFSVRWGSKSQITTTK